MNKWIGKEGLKGGCLEYEKTCRMDWRGWINERIDELERKGWRVVLGVWKNAGSSVSHFFNYSFINNYVNLTTMHCPKGKWGGE